MGATKEHQKALAQMLMPVRTRTRIAVAVQIVGSIAAVVPFIGLVELGRALMSVPMNTHRVWWMILVVAIGLVVRAQCEGAALSITHLADIKMQRILRRDIADKLGRVPLAWFSRTNSGEVRKAVQNDIAELHYLVAHATVETTAAIATPIISLVYAFVLDWRLGLTAIATLPLYAIALAWMMRDSTAHLEKMNTGVERISATIVEFISGIAVVKTFGRAGRAHRRFVSAADQFNDDFAGYVTPMLRIEALSSLTLSAPLILLVNLGLGYWYASSGWVDAVSVLVATLIAMVLPTAIMTVSLAMHSRQQTAAAAARILSLLNEPELEETSNGHVPQDNSIDVDGVSFSYRSKLDNSEVPALVDVSITMPPGSLTALVGPSGSGKSTLATLIARFADPDTGHIRIGGVDVRDIDQSTLYRHVGFVLQDVGLLSMSVRDNIRLGRPDATDDDIIAAARTAQIHDRIMESPKGYDAIVGEDEQYSGGEAQRMSIARALLADTPILILDEATAFADPDSEAQLQSAIGELVRGRTVVVIAHRLGSIVHADNIVVLDGGRVVEQGHHRELLSADGRYAQMWASYTSGAARADQMEGLTL